MNVNSFHYYNTGNSSHTVSNRSAIKMSQRVQLNTPQNISLKSIFYADQCGTTLFCLPVLRYELSRFSYFEISATRSAFRGNYACAHCVLRIIKPAGQLTRIAYTHIAAPLTPPLPYTRVQKLFRARSIYFT